MSDDNEARARRQACERAQRDRNTLARIARAHEKEDDIGIGKAEARARRSAMIAHARIELARVDSIVDNVQVLFR